MITAYDTPASYQAALDPMYWQHSEDFTSVASYAQLPSFELVDVALDVSITGENGSVFTLPNNVYDGALASYQSDSGLYLTVDDGLVYGMGFDVFLTDFTSAPITSLSPGVVYVDGMQVGVLNFNDPDTFFGFVSDTPVNSVFIDYNGVNFLTLDNINIAYTPVPEASTYAALAGLAALGLLGMRRRHA